MEREVMTANNKPPTSDTDVLRKANKGTRDESFKYKCLDPFFHQRTQGTQAHSWYTSGNGYLAATRLKQPPSVTRATLRLATLVLNHQPLFSPRVRAKTWTSNGAGDQTVSIPFLPASQTLEPSTRSRPSICISIMYLEIDTTLCPTTPAT